MTMQRETSFCPDFGPQSQALPYKEKNISFQMSICVHVTFTDNNIYQE